LLLSGEMIDSNSADLVVIATRIARIAIREKEKVPEMERKLCDCM